MVNLGSRLKELRLKKRLTQTDVAKRLGITPVMISSYELEKRQPSYDVLIKLATFFGVTTDFLLGLEKDKERTFDAKGLSERDFEAISNLIDALRDK